MTLLRDIVERKRPDVPEAALAAARKWFEDNREKFSNSCNFAQFKDDGSCNSNLNQPCHSRIQYFPGGFTDIACVATDIAIDRREEWYKQFVGDRSGGSSVEAGAKEWSAGMTWERVDAYLKYFLYESYFSPFIINKDDIDFVKRFGIIVTADIPAALLQNIMISSRYFIECSPESFDMFNDLTAKGVHPDIAYVVSFSTAISSYTIRTGNQNLETTHVFSLQSHRTTPLLSKQGMKNMMNDDLAYKDVLTEDKNYRNYHTYNGGSQFFGQGNFIKELLEESKDLRKSLSEYRKRRNSGPAYSPPNPFAAATPKAASGNPLDFTYPEMFECLVPYIDANNLLEK